MSSYSGFRLIRTFIHFFPLFKFMRLYFKIIYAVLKRDVLTPCAGAAAFWIWNFCPALVLGAAMVFIAKVLNDMHEERERLGYRSVG